MIISRYNTQFNTKNEKKNMERMVPSFHVTFIFSRQGNRFMCKLKCRFGSIELNDDAVPNEYCCKHECLCVCLWGESFNAAPFDCCE